MNPAYLAAAAQVGTVPDLVALGSAPELRWGVPENTWEKEVAARLSDVRRRIDEAAASAGRPAGSVRLLAVSKNKPPAAIRAAYAAGQRTFGENYAQELAQKAEEVRDLVGIEWHFIGRLQRNKAKQVVQAARTVHTIDRAELAAELGRRATAMNVRARALVEVNMSGEASKGGCTPDELGAVLAAIRAERSLEAVGLMTIPPMTDDPDGARPFFAALRALRERHGGAVTLPELSMGMTHDFPVAIAEGATIVRVGTAIFGARG
jgi:pyridoxal phosphate enzyme (YggS family)